MLRTVRAKRLGDDDEPELRRIVDRMRGGAAVSALCIVPAQRKSRLDAIRRFEVFMDHPKLEKRLERLSDLAGQLGRRAED